MATALGKGRVTRGYATRYAAVKAAYGQATAMNLAIKQWGLNTFLMMIAMGKIVP